MKIALIAFQGELMCFAHVLINALKMTEKGHEVAVVIEGAACKLIPTLSDEAKNPFFKQYTAVIEKGLLKAVCKACANKMGTLSAAEEAGLPINGEMSGHPSLEKYISEGYQVITF